jgi:uncharacterized membrane protein HdeD (DUF308 family)
MRRFVIVLGVVLLVLGVIGLVHPNFNYHQQEEVAKLGPIKATVDEEKTAQIPATVSITLLLAGIGLVVFGPRMKR